MAEINKTEVMERHNQQDLITKEECDLILEKILKEENVKGKLKSHELVPELGTIGYLGEYFHLYLKYQKENESEVSQIRLFVKTIPYGNPDLKDFIEISGILKKESTIYIKLLNELKKLSPNIWCPECYLVKNDLFVMQNIVDLGYEPLKDPAKFLNKQEIQTILKGLANMHACSFAYEKNEEKKNEEKKKKEKKNEEKKNEEKINEEIKIGNSHEDMLYEVSVSKNVAWHKAGINAVLAVTLEHPMNQTELLQLYVKKELPETLDLVYKMVDPSNEFRNVFCHRDVWGGNVFFDKSDPYSKGAVFVDFQFSRYCPPAIDVLMTLYVNMKPSDRKLIAEECYTYYYEQLSQQLLNMSLNCEDFITLDEFKKSLNDLALFGALYNCISATLLRVPWDYLKDMKLNRPEDFYRYINVDRTKEILGLINRDVEFKDYMFQCVQDMMDVVLNNHYYKKK